MPTIFDNIEKRPEEGLNKTLKNRRAVFCIGYFNVRGWQKVDSIIDKLPGRHLPDELDDDNKYHFRVLIGLQRLQE